MPVSDTSPYVQLWSTGAGGGHGLFKVNGDPNSDMGMTGFQLAQFYQNTTDNPLTTTVAEGMYRPSDMVFDTVHGKFFIADSDLAGHNRILQGNIADLVAGNPPTLTVLYEDTGAGAPTRIDNLEIDPNNGIVYFTHGDNLEKILYNSAGQVPIVLFNSNVNAITSPSGVANPAGNTNNLFNDMVINFATGEIYLSSTRVVSSGTSDQVQKNFIYQLTGLTASSGTNAFTFGVGNTGTARLLPVTPNDDLYNPNPGTTASPAIPANEPFFFPVEHGSIDGLAIDPVTNTLYFSTGTILFDHDVNSGTPAILSRGGIFSYALSGNPTGTYGLVYQQVAGSGPQGLLGDLEIDPTTGRWYVTDYTGGTVAPGDEGVWTGNLNGTGTPTLFSLINDPAGQIPSGVTIDIAPTLTGTETGAATTETAGSGSGFSSAAFGLTGLDSGDFENADQADQLAGAQVRISSGFGSSPGSNEQLTINGTTAGVLGSGIAYSYNSGTGVMTLTGINSFANYEAALALVAYAIDGDNPDNYGASPTRTLSYSVFDGLLLSDEYDTVVTIQGTNDAPVNTVGGGVATSEDASAVAVTGLSVNDPDSSALTVTLSATHGTINVSTVVAGGLGAGQVSGNGTGSVVLSGTQSEINATLAAMNGVTYTPTADYNGSDSLQMVSDDGALSDTDSVGITISAVADIANDAASTNEDVAVSIMVLANDSFENIPAITGFTQGANGSVTLNDNGTVGNTADDYLVYTGNADFNGADSFSYTVTSGGATETATVNVTVAAVADIANDNVTVAEDSGANALNLLANDSFENASRSITAVTQGANGTVAINDNGTPLNTADDFVTYTPGANYVGSDSFTYTVTSGGTTETASVSVTVTNVNDAPTGVTGNLSAPEDAANGSAAGTLSAQDPDSSSFTWTLLDNAGGRFAMDVNGNVTVADGLLLDYEQQNSHTIRVRVTDDMGASSEFDVNVSVADVHGEDVLGDGRDNVFWGGVEMDILRGMDGNDYLKGGGGGDQLFGGNGVDTLDGGAGADVLYGGDGNDVFVFRKGEANGDTIMDFFGRGNALGDSIVLVGYAAGTTFTRVGPGNSNVYQINDHGSIETVTIFATGQVHTGDWEIVTVYDYTFG